MSPAVLHGSTFQPAQVLFAGSARAGCRVCVTIPARDEAETLPACLSALADQVDERGVPLPADSFEVLLLVNNCTDDSAAIVRRWQESHPRFPLQLAERQFKAQDAHAGTARRLLMDTAWQRLGGEKANRHAIILATDADSTVARDWIVENIAAVAAGADAVGGAVHLRAEDLRLLPTQVQTCYLRDRRYAELVAELESRLDPQAGDPWPRHLDHFGSSLACTAQAYARAGGMPVVATLEDAAFVDRLRRADLRLRHEPRVRVFTSARLEGRASVGLAAQLRLWNDLEGEEEHQVQSAAFLVHRFQTLHQLRSAFAGGTVGELTGCTMTQRAAILDAKRKTTSIPAFLSAIDCDALILDLFDGVQYESITAALGSLASEIARAG